MKLFGYILIVLNFVAAIAFVVLGFMDYAKRESWAYANFVYDVAYDGLPIDDKQLDDTESPIAYEIADDTKKEWFGSDPVSTQVQEVDRVKAQVDGKLNALNDDAPKQTVELAKILGPFAQHNAEREWLLSVRTHLATPEDAAKLQKRLRDAFPAAVQAYTARPDDLKFPQAFVEAVRALGPSPAPAFEQTFLKQLPAKPENTFETAVAAAQKVAAVPMNPEQEAHLRAEAFLKSLRGDAATLRNLRDDPTKNKDTLDEVNEATQTAVHEQLKTQLGDLFDAAHDGPQSIDPNAKPGERLRDYQRVAIAHLLFNLVEYLQDDAADKGVFGSPAYARVISVIGANAAVSEINSDAWQLQRIAEELNGARDLERGEFAAAHRAMIDDLQTRAVNLQYSTDLLTRKTAQKADVEVTVNRNDAVVKQARADLAEARAATDKMMVELRKVSDKLHERRIEGRDLLGDNVELEKRIRELEKKR